MFSHVMVGTEDTERAPGFYTAIFTPLGIVPIYRDATLARYGRADENLPFFTVTLPLDEAPATAGNGTMVAFVAASRSAVREAHGAALARGGTCEGPPGLRPDYGAGYYGAYFRDLDGNKLHVVCSKIEG